MDDVHHLIAEAERILQRKDEDFEMLLANYRVGPRTLEAYRALQVQVDALDDERAYGEWMRWYNVKQIWDSLFICITCYLYLPCAIGHKCCYGKWNGSAAWRANHPRPAHWNLNHRIPPSERDLE